MTLVLVSAIAFWTLAACFAVILCGAAKGGDRAQQPEPAFVAAPVSETIAPPASRAEQPEPVFAAVQVSEALASLATRP